MSVHKFKEAPATGRQRDGKCKGPEVGKGFYVSIGKSPTVAR